MPGVAGKRGDAARRRVAGFPRLSPRRGRDTAWARHDQPGRRGAASSFPTFAPVARAMTRSLKQELYVTAARSLGASDLWISSDTCRNAAGPLISLTALRMGLSLATASGFSFPRPWAPAPTPEWGSMLDAGREYLWLAPRLVLAPGAALFFSSLGLYLLGDGLRQPKAGLKRRRHSTEARAYRSGD